MSRLDRVLRGYVDCSLWSTTDNSDDAGGEPLDANYGRTDIDESTLARMRADCEAFIAKADALLDEAKDDEHIGHDFWLTRNRHGAGFWDGDYPEHGDALTEIAHAFGEVNLYVGDDGLIYQMGTES